MSGAARRALTSLPAMLLAATAVGAAVIVSTGGTVQTAAGALLVGALGSPYAVSESILRAVPLAFTGLAVAVAFRAGVWNIGGEGQLLVGAIGVAAVARLADRWPGWALLPVCLAAAAAAGAVWGGVAAFLRVRRNVPEVIATIMLNFVALNLVAALVHGPLMERAGGYPQSQPLPLGATLLPLHPPARLHTGLILALAAALITGTWLFRTVSGFRLRVVGQNPRAAEAAGIDVPRAITTAFLVSGAIAGLGGGVELMGVTHVLSGSFSPGWGYTAVAVALLGNLHPAGVLVAALLFGALDAGSTAMEAQAGVSHVVVQVVQGTIIFFAAIRAALATGAARET